MSTMLPSRRPPVVDDAGDAPARTPIAAGSPPDAAWRAYGGAVVRGLVGGAGFGIAYRAWMRLVSTESAFSWSGTLFIVGLCTLVVVVTSIVATLRARSSSRWRRGVGRGLGVVAMGLLGAGPGAITVPVWLFGGLAWGRVSWRRSVRLVFATLAVLGFTPLVLEARDLAPDLGVARTVAGLAGYVLLTTVMAGLFRVSTASPAPRRDVLGALEGSM